MSVKTILGGIHKILVKTILGSIHKISVNTILGEYSQDISQNYFRGYSQDISQNYFRGYSQDTRIFIVLLYKSLQDISQNYFRGYSQDISQNYFKDTYYFEGLVFFWLFHSSWKKKFPNINKTNSHLLPLLTEHRKRSWHMKVEIQVLAWDRHKNVVGLNRSMRSQTLPRVII